MAANNKIEKRTVRGEVVSSKMGKTIVVKVERTYKHPLVKKVMRTLKSYKVHDETGAACVGDIVDIYQGRPVSKTKYMYLAQVVSAAEKNNK